MIISLTFALVLILVQFPYYLQSFDNRFAKALISKYAEVAPSPLHEPILFDPALKAKVVFKGLNYPTSMAFLGSDDILVTEKDIGTVQRILNGVKTQQPLLNVSVATFGHRGMLGIATNNPNTSTTILDNENDYNHNNNSYVFYIIVKLALIPVMIF
jgi:glucose/arabinose dehydrogenase